MVQHRTLGLARESFLISMANLSETKDESYKHNEICMKKEKISVNGQIISQMRDVNESGKMYKA